MGTEHTIISGVVVSVLTPLCEFYDSLKWFLLLGMALILIDYRFGVKAAHKRARAWKEKNPGHEPPEDIRFRKSRAWRRTGNKVIDYLCWLTVAGLTGKAIEGNYDVPYVDLAVPLVIIAVIYRIEYTSAINNYYYVRGIKKKVKLFGFLDKHKDILSEEPIEPVKEEENATHV